jgi:hypothetical protein
MLRGLKANEVRVKKLAGLPARYYRLVDPDTAVVCSPSGHFFEADGASLSQCLSLSRAVSPLVSVSDSLFQ